MGLQQKYDTKNKYPKENVQVGIKLSKPFHRVSCVSSREEFTGALLHSEDVLRRVHFRGLPKALSER